MSDHNPKLLQQLLLHCHCDGCEAVGGDEWYLLASSSLLDAILISFVYEYHCFEHGFFNMTH